MRWSSGIVRLALGHAALDRDGACDRIDHAAELAQRAVAHELDDAAMVLGDQRLDQLLAVRLETLERSRLVALDQARIADHVGRENGGEAAVDAGSGHGVNSNSSKVSISTLAAANGASLADPAPGRQGRNGPGLPLLGGEQAVVIADVQVLSSLHLLDQASEAAGGRGVTAVSKRQSGAPLWSACQLSGSRARPTISWRS